MKLTKTTFMMLWKIIIKQMFRMENSTDMIEHKLQHVKLFDTQVEQEVDKIIGGDTSRLLDYTFPEDSYYHTLVEKGEENQWVAKRVPINKDIECYKNKLSLDEKNAYNRFLSFLIFMDSIQVNNLPVLLHYTTSMDFARFLSRQIYEESNHSNAYSYMLNSICNREESHELIYLWKKENKLQQRMQKITDVYQKFVDNPTKENFILSVIANYLLEGIYFYNGFIFFHSLANRDLMQDSNNIIKLIKRDELIHCSAFAHTIRRIKQENEEEFITLEETIYKMFLDAYDTELKFGKWLYDDNIIGITNTSIETYTKYLVNTRLKQIGLNPLFEKIHNPYTNLEKEAGVEDETSERTNNFEMKSKSYQTPEVFNDWEDC